MNSYPFPKNEKWINCSALLANIPKGIMQNALTKLVILFCVVHSYSVLPVFFVLYMLRCYMHMLFHFGPLY